MNGIAHHKNIFFFLLTLLVGKYAIAQQPGPDLTQIRKFTREQHMRGTGPTGGRIKIGQKYQGTPTTHKKAFAKIPQTKKFDISKQKVVTSKAAAAPKVAAVQTAQDILLKKAPTSFHTAPSTVSARQAAFKARMAGYRGRFQQSKFATDMKVVGREAKVGLKKMPKIALTSLKPSMLKRLQKKLLSKEERKALTQFGRSKTLTVAQQQTVKKLKSTENALVNAYYQGTNLTKKQLKMVAEIQRAETKQTKRGAPKRFIQRKGMAIAGTAIQEYEKNKEDLASTAKDYAKIRKLPGSIAKIPGKAWRSAQETGSDIKSLKRKSFSPTHRYQTSKKQISRYKTDSVQLSDDIARRQEAAAEKLEAAQSKYEAMTKADRKTTAGKALKKEMKGYNKELKKKLSVKEQDYQRTAQKIQQAQAIASMGKKGAMQSLKGQAKMGFGYGGMKARLKSAAISGAIQVLGSSAQIGIQQGIAAMTKKYETRPEKRNQFAKPQFDPVDDDIVIESK